MKHFGVYAKSIAIPLIIGGIIGLIMSGFMDYDMLQKPPFSPSGIIFPIVWTILYILMGISYARIKVKNESTFDMKYTYYIQLFFNAMWSIIFFALKWRLLAFFWLIGLIVLVIIMVIKFYKKDKIAGLLQIPYLIWILFASYLNLAIYLLNI